MTCQTVRYSEIVSNSCSPCIARPIIQARMGSTRLPGKILMRIRNRPLLSYLIERLSQLCDRKWMILATSEGHADKVLERVAEEEEVGIFRGSENDVLDRFFQAAKAFNVEYIMRITADCPLIDPILCHKMCELYMAEKPDLVYTGQSFADGMDCEVFSYDALKKVWGEAKRPSEREHVTQFFYNNQEDFEIVCVENDRNEGHYRLTVDNGEDFQVVKAIIDHLYYPDGKIFTLQEVIQFLNKRQDIFQVNSGITRDEGLIRSLIEEEQTD